MSKLRIISDGIDPAELELVPGVITVGRQEDNRFQIKHSTVSGHHCEIVCEENRVLVRDLGSTNGTFVNEQRTQEAALLPGQVLRLGDIQLQYEGSGKPRLRATPAASTAPNPELPADGTVAVQHPCYKHPGTEGEWICCQCRTVCCAPCTNERSSGGKKWRFCPVCNGKVNPIEDDQKRREVMNARNSLTFTQRLGSSFKYPFVKGGIFLLLVGTIVYWMVGVAQFIVKFVPVYGFLASGILLTFSWGWMFAYIQKIIVSCANDEDILPDWPEIAEWNSDLVQPFLLCLLTLAVCFGPALLYSWFAADTDSSPFFFYALLFLGLIYLPMSLIVVALTGSVKSANPFVVLPAITKVPRDYALVCLLFFLGLGVWNGCRFLFDYLVGPKIFSRIFSSLPAGFVFFYCMVACIRALGLMYRCNRAKFGWFND